MNPDREGVEELLFALLDREAQVDRGDELEAENVPVDPLEDPPRVLDRVLASQPVTQPPFLVGYAAAVEGTRPVRLGAEVGQIGIPSAGALAISLGPLPPAISAACDAVVVKEAVAVLRDTDLEVLRFERFVELVAMRFHDSLLLALPRTIGPGGPRRIALRNTRGSLHRGHRTRRSPSS
jgi:hypothetical protein